jgi:hypothetical protein
VTPIKAIIQSIIAVTNQASVNQFMGRAQSLEQKPRDLGRLGPQGNNYLGKPTTTI